MNTLVKSAFAAILLSAVATGAALAAEDCCCKDKDGKMTCCDKKGEAAPNAPKPQQQPEHQH
ncbi:MAG: ammonium transporter family protein [Phenylobacterium sp.]|uniref:ammonium transporter family protein n=1 Tax=Phenylobacterium sp. TaxID=1871053 RepID=UPI001A2C8722|nr:ammonium transporter family protein [Phenylobacterium sp.]MBJ7411253.1 ammonium transporter family protein [Phenylobacterium sp.]